MQREIGQEVNKYSRNWFYISKGYGTQHHARASAPGARQVGPVHRIERGNDDHLGVQQTVRNNLRWMSEKYVGSFFWTVFKERSYQGLANT